MAIETLDDRVVVITGAGSGIGRALALECGARGARLALSDVDADGLAGTAHLVESGGAREVHAGHLDVADRAGFEAYAQQTAQRFGRVNVVVNNAGVSLTGDLVDLSWEDIDWITGVNYAGVLHGTKLFLPYLIASGEGHLVNVSSLFGLISVPGQSLYNASKYAVRGLSEAVRGEMLVAGHPVGVTSVHPGGVRTAIARNARAGRGGDVAATARIFDEQLARTTPERAARIIVRGVLRDRARVLVGADAHVLHHLARLAGSRYQDAVAMAVRRFGPPQA